MRCDAEKGSCANLQNEGNPSRAAAVGKNCIIWQCHKNANSASSFMTYKSSAKVPERLLLLEGSGKKVKNINDNIILVGYISLLCEWGAK